MGNLPKRRFPSFIGPMLVDTLVRPGTAAVVTCGIRGATVVEPDVLAALGTVAD
jgi:hypothetical protein